MIIYKKELTDQFEPHGTTVSISFYKKLIRNWHEKATTEDFFSKFTFEYLAFIAILKKYKEPESREDRQAIQKLKRNKDLKVKYLEKISQNTDLAKLIKYLEKNPLDDEEELKWWNCSEINLISCEKAQSSTTKKGVIKDNQDWPNIIEFIYTVRNNLFHGDKDPEDDRDKFLVKYAYKLLNPLVEILMEELRMGEG